MDAGACQGYLPTGVSFRRPLSLRDIMGLPRHGLLIPVLSFAHGPCLSPRDILTWADVLPHLKVIFPSSWFPLILAWADCKLKWHSHLCIFTDQANHHDGQGA